MSIQITDSVYKGNPYQISSYQDLIKINPEFKRDGYMVSSWNTKPDGSGEIIPLDKTFIISSDNTIYAQWKQKQELYNLTILGGGGTPEIQNMTYDAVYDISEGIRAYHYTRVEKGEGYQLVGVTATGYITESNEPYIERDCIYIYPTTRGNITVTHNWVEKTYNVNLYTNNKKYGYVKYEGTPKYQETISCYAVLRSDYNFFVEWSDGDKNPVKEIVMTADVELSATFGELYDLNYHTNY